MPIQNSALPLISFKKGNTKKFLNKICTYLMLRIHEILLIRTLQYYTEHESVDVTPFSFPGDRPNTRLIAHNKFPYLKIKTNIFSLRFLESRLLEDDPVWYLSCYMEHVVYHDCLYRNMHRYEVSPNNVYYLK